MASISRDSGGYRRIQFVAPNGKRKAIRLGKVNQRTAEAVKVKVEALLAAILTSSPPDDETARWLSTLDNIMYDKLAAVDLIPSRGKPMAETTTVAQFIDQYIDTRRKSANHPGTVINHLQTRRLLVGFFGETCLLKDVTPGSCDDWRVHLESEGYASATIGRHVKRARQFFRAAVRKKLIAENPMQDVKAASQVNKKREYFVTRQEIEKIIGACPDAEWRLIVALARYGGLRTPSETFALTWHGVDWERGRIHIESPKTACHEGKESRDIPMFPELRPYLEAVFDQAEPGTVYVISKHRLGSMNLRTQLERIMARAGVAQWPRLFQNMRASRETELAQEYPLHVVTAWIGNSARIAARHYLQVTDSDFERANQGGADSGAPTAQKAAQQASALFRKISQSSPQVLELCELMQNLATPYDVLRSNLVTPTGSF